MHRIRFSWALIALLIVMPITPSFGLELQPRDVLDADLSASDDKIVFLVRHGEKCTEPASDPGLTELGKERAQALVRVLQDVDVDAIYSTPLHRTRDTAKPLAEAHGLEIIETPIKSGFLEDLADAIRASDASRIVVSGHSNTTPRVANLLAGTEFPDLDESEYDRLFVVHLAADGSAQVSILRFGPESGPPESPCG